MPLAPKTITTTPRRQIELQAYESCWLLIKIWLNINKTFCVLIFYNGQGNCNQHDAGGITQLKLSRHVYQLSIVKPKLLLLL